MSRLTRFNVPPEVWDRLDEESKDDEYVDNYRAYRIGDEVGEIEYEMARRGGCCGEVDKIVEISGVQYMIGYNYCH